MLKKIIPAILALIMITSTAFASNETSAAQNILKAPADLHAVRNSSSSIRLYWKKVDTATGYNIYYINHKTKKKKRIATTRKTYFYDRNLKSHKVHHYKVQAVRGSSRSKLSYAVCAKNWITRNVTNMKRVNVNRHNVTVDLLENPNYMLPESRALKPHKVKAKVIASCGGRKPFNKNVRWFSTNPKIAKVKKDGTIIPVNGGKCEIYAKAQNGVNSKHIKLTVKDYAFVDSFAKPEGLKTGEFESMAVEILQEKRNELCEIISAVSKTKSDSVVQIRTFANETCKIHGINNSTLENNVKRIAQLPYRFYLYKRNGVIKFEYGYINEKTEDDIEIYKGIRGVYNSPKFSPNKWKVGCFNMSRELEGIPVKNVLFELMKIDGREKEYREATPEQLLNLLSEYGLKHNMYSPSEVDDLIKLHQNPEE